MTGVALAAWQRLWRELGADGADESTFERLLAAYSEPHRHYHTLQHLRECLAHLDGARALAARPAEVELALWFHDAVYDVRAHENEARSAAWAADCLRQAGLPPAMAHRIQALIMATRHDAAPQDGDARLVVDIDLAILGAPAPRFDEYDAQIRSEYAHVPHAEYRRARCRVLSGFRARPRLYATDWFHDRFEAQARKNLARAIQQWGSDSN